MKERPLQRAQLQLPAWDNCNNFHPRPKLELCDYLPVPWTHQCIRNLASQVLANRFAVYFFAPNQSSTSSCQMLSIRCLSSRSLLWRLCLCLPKRTRLAHSKEIRWQLWPYCTKNMLKPTRGTKNTSTSNQTEKVVLSSCVKLCQFSFASFNVTAVVCYSGLSWCSRCLGRLQNNMVLRSSETFMGFKSEILSLQSKITGHNPWGTFLSEKNIKKHALRVNIGRKLPR